MCFYYNGACTFHEMYNRQPVLQETRPDQCIPADSTITTTQAIGCHYHCIGYISVQLSVLGIRVSSEIFQAAIDELIQGLDRVMAYRDDVIIFGATREENYSRLKSVLNRLIQGKMFIKLAKCKFGVCELEFLGFEISATGYQPDPERLELLVGMNSPWNRRHLCFIMGCLHSYSPFIPNFTTREQLLSSVQLPGE